MPDEGLEKINFLEGIFVGLYGGWFISFIDKLTFKPIGPLGIWYEPLCVMTTIAAIIILFVYVLYAPNIMQEHLRFTFIVSFAPLAGMFGALSQENLTFQLLFFGIMGFIFYFGVFVCEIIKIKHASKISIK